MARRPMASSSVQRIEGAQPVAVGDSCCCGSRADFDSVQFGVRSTLP